MTGGRLADRPRLSFRHPVEADHPALVRQARAWWPSPVGPVLLPRLWLRHFSGTCWLAETEEGRLVGFVVGLVGAETPIAHLELVGVDPNFRRRGVGRTLVERFVASVRERGAGRIEAIVWAGDRPAIAFAQALGFRPADGPGTTRIYGLPAYPDYDGEGDDRARLVLSLE